MTFLISTLAIFAIWHFVYESIIAPTIRLHLRNRLFAVRDDLRRAKLVHMNRDEERAFKFVHDGLNNFLNRLPRITIWNMIRIKRELMQDTNKKKVMDDHLRTVMKCGNAKIVDAFEDANKILERAFIANMGAWFIYIVPIALIVGALKKLSTILPELVMFPSRDVERLIKDGDRCCAM